MTSGAANISQLTHDPASRVQVLLLVTSCSFTSVTMEKSVRFQLCLLYGHIV